MSCGNILHLYDVLKSKSKYQVILEIWGRPDFTELMCKITPDTCSYLRNYSIYT